MTENNNSPSTTLQDVSRRELRDLVRSQLQALLEQNDLQGAKAISTRTTRRYRRSY